MEANASSDYSAEAFDPLLHLESAVRMYNQYGVLLSDSELSILRSLIGAGNMPRSAMPLISDSDRSVARDLDLQTRTLEDAEEKRRLAEEAHARAEHLLRESEMLRGDLEVAKLATEEELYKERKFRLQLENNEFKRSFAHWMVILVAVSVVLQFTAAVMGVDSSQLNQIVLLLIQSLGIAIGSVFASRDRQRGQEDQ